MTYLSLCGMLGYGYPEESLTEGIKAGPLFIGVDAGSTDPGPYYLGSGTHFVQPEQVRRDLESALVAARSNDIPLIIGSAGGAGAAPHLDAFRRILIDIANRRELHFRLAEIPAEVSADIVISALREGRLAPCGSVPEPGESSIRECTNLVAQMGTEPFIEAIRGGADVVLAGRSCDTAIFAAVPIIHGFDPGIALHAAKIAECGTLCAVPGGANDSLLVTLDSDGFTVRPTNRSKRCLPRTVAAHALYEQPSPHEFVEPEGAVDLRSATYTALDDRTVRVTGTTLRPAASATIKVEGARRVGCRSLAIAGTSDPLVIANIDLIEREVGQKVAAMTAHMAGSESISLRFLKYGIDGVTGRRPAGSPLPAEAGIVIEAIAATKELADTAVSLARSTALHHGFPGRKSTAGNFAFPFSPSDVSAGDVYEFAVYHVMTVDDLSTLFPVNYTDV